MTDLRDFFAKVINDPRIGPVHISCYLALLHLKNLNSCERDGSFVVSRVEVMLYARIRSRDTYSKAMKVLVLAGFISYYPANHRKQLSVVRVLGCF